MGPTWDPPGSCRAEMGPMLAPWTLLSGSYLLWLGSLLHFQSRQGNPQSCDKHSQQYQKHLCPRTRSSWWYPWIHLGIAIDHNNIMYRKRAQLWSELDHYFNNMRYAIQLSVHHTWCRGDSRSLWKLQLFYQNQDDIIKTECFNLSVFMITMNVSLWLHIYIMTVNPCLYVLYIPNALNWNRGRMTYLRR